MPRPFLQPSCASRSRFERRVSRSLLPFGFAWLFLALRLSLRGRAIPAPHWRMLPSHLSVTRTHLGITRHLIHRRGPVTGSTSSSGSFAGMHFGLVSPSGSLISGLELPPACSSVTCSCSLKITFSYVPRFVSTFSGSRRSSKSFSGLPGACALAIKFGCVPDFIFTFACTRSRCSPKSLFAGLALPHAFTLVE